MPNSNNGWSKKVGVRRSAKARRGDSSKIKMGTNRSEERGKIYVNERQQNTFRYGGW